MPKKAKPGSERDVQRRLITWLRKRGWFVINTSGSWASARGMRGVPDLICIYKGATIFVEIKGYGKDELRESQVKFFNKLGPHMGPTVDYMIVNDKWFEKALEALKEVENDRNL